MIAHWLCVPCGPTAFDRLLFSPFCWYTQLARAYVGKKIRFSPGKLVAPWLGGSEGQLVYGYSDQD